MKSNYKGSIDLNTLIESSSIKQIDDNVNVDGQVKFTDCAASPENFLEYPIYPFGLTLKETIKSKSEYDFELSGGSVM